LDEADFVNIKSALEKQAVQYVPDAGGEETAANNADPENSSA
jgi:hypothetical protein